MYLLFRGHMPVFRGDAPLRGGGGGGGGRRGEGLPCAEKSPNCFNICSQINYIQPVGTYVTPKTLIHTGCPAKRTSCLRMPDTHFRCSYFLCDLLTAREADQLIAGAAPLSFHLLPRDPGLGIKPLLICRPCLPPSLSPTSRGGAPRMQKLMSPLLRV